MKQILFMLIILLSSACTNALSYKEASNMNVDREQVIKIAHRFLAEKRFEISDKNILLDETNSKWKEFSSDEKFMSDNKETLKRLVGKDYWAVNFYPKDKLMLGGEAWVFIDKYSGDVILFFLLK